MGGFLQALGAGVAGAGQAAGPYGEQQRELMFRTFELQQKNALDSLDRMIAVTTDPERHARLIGMRADVANAPYGKDHTALWNKLQMELNPHPTTERALSQGTQVQTRPAPAGPGQTNGTTVTPTIVPPIPQTPPSMQGGMAASMAPPGMSRAPEPPAAQPADSLVSPQAEAHGPMSVPGPAQPQAAPQVQPIGGDLGDIILPQYRQAAAGHYIPPALAAAAQPYLQREAELGTKRSVYQMEVAQRQQVADKIKASPYYENLPDMAKAELDAWVGSPQGQTPPLYGAATFLREHETVVDASAMPKEQKAMYGIPADATGYQRIKLTFNDQPGGWIGPAPAGFGTAINPDLTASQFSRNAPNQPVPIVGVGGPALSGPGAGTAQFTTPAGHVAIGTKANMLGGGTPKEVAGVINPLFIPRITSKFQPVQTVDDQGNQVEELVPITTVSSLGGVQAPGATSAGTNAGGGSGNKQFPRGLTPEQRMTAEGRLKQYDLALDRMTNIRSKLHMLDSLIDAGKIEMQLDSTGIMHAFINRSMDLTPGEAEFIGDFRTMMEDINLIRGPLGATGFRGPEAWAALQAQRGQLLAKPEITRQVMDNTIKAFNAQRDATAHGVNPKANNGPLKFNLRNGGVLEF